MKCNCLAFCFLALLLVVAPDCTAPGLAEDGFTNDLIGLNYSQELIEHAQFGTSLGNKDFSVDNPMAKRAPQADPEPKKPTLSEVDAVQEQLTELGRTRSMTAYQPLHSEMIRDNIDSFWMAMRSTPDPDATMSDALRQKLHENIETALGQAGYEIKQLTLLPLPANLGIPQLKAVIRVVRPLRGKDPYREMQKNLAEIKDLCLRTTTIDGICYLGEMTTFLAENPNNNYFYEKTILIP